MIAEAFLAGLIPDATAEQRRALSIAYDRGRADEALALSSPPPVRPTVDQVLLAVATASGVADVRRGGLIAHSRRYATERAAAAVILREDARLSYPACADALKYCHHGSVMQHLAGWQTNPRIVDLVTRARALLSERSSQ